ncbi:MAG: ERAP1-like C-terminal domain-containing protein [Planctomycetes bacterium]|nr:ERAP1-like C-terminal domain-containing protein [Planctomycetota bacterium]
MRALLLAACALLAGCIMTDTPQTPPEPGIDIDLAHARAARISDLRYVLHFDLEEGADHVAGRARVDLRLADTDQPLVMDFVGEGLTLTVNGQSVEPCVVANHVVIPTRSLLEGANSITATFRSRVAQTGTPLTRYRDRSDGKEYVYTLVVPADAHRLFPCLDQPDLKAQYTLSLTTPAAWVAVANGRETRTVDGDRARWEFSKTAPLPTYLFAFAAGPFDVITQAGVAGAARGLTDPMRVYVRPSKRGDLDTPTLIRMHGSAVSWQETYFGYDYPFGKLDIVLCPGFPYGGMEHAGAIFYRESALVFDHDPTALELLRRSTLIYHEVSHQWFGNLVTMRWFDDLWLKEGFATFIGYRTLDVLEPEMNAWTRFHQRVKPAAYRIDETDGTTPIWQELPNLADAKSAYGPIVYNKAPAVLRQLEHHLGAGEFRDGVRVFLKRHAFANATWRDLLAAMSEVSGRDLGAWSRHWILERGMPRVLASADSARIRQEDALGLGRTWPFSVTVLAGRKDGSRETRMVDLTQPPSPAAEAPYAWQLPNADGVAFAKVILDAPSLAFWLSRVPEEPDPLVKAVAFTAVWDSVKAGACAPERFVELALELVDRERDPQTWSSAMGALSTTLVRYMPPDAAREPLRRVADVLGRLLVDPTAEPIRLQALRRLARLARDDDALTRVERILDGDEVIANISLGVQDRFRLVTALLAAQRPGAAERLAELERAGTDVARWAYQAKAALPNADMKAAYFNSFLDPEQPPEQWVSGALSTFHWPGQEALFLPYLERALDAAPWVKDHRKIFFMPAWLESFLGAHASKEALAIVDRWLDTHPDLSPDIRRKLLVPLHELRRTVRIRSVK